MHYDFREKEEISGFVYDTIEKMHPQELEKVHDAIFRIREEEKELKSEQAKAWFHQAIVPTMIDIAKKHSGTLDIEEDDNEIVATIRSEGDMEIDLDTGKIRMAVYLANSLSVATIKEEREISFIFKKENLLR